MTPERWRRIDEVFGRAVELATIDRAAFVRASCGDDDQIYAEVMALLASDEDASGSLRAVVDHAARIPHAIGSLVPGRLADRFAIRRQLGAGGMGVVYEAFDDRRGELVALKTLPHASAREIADLKREFRTVADVVHPNLVRLHELFCDGDRWFFTMARVDGVPFVDRVRRGVHDRDPSAATQRPTLDEPVLRRALRGLCEGVRAIHAAGQLHRDLKPSNVLVDDRGHVTILDFGLARRMSRDGESSRELGGAGTPAYMAPEQVREDGACRASDWYAVGGMLFEALTGKRPFEATNLVALLAAKQSGPPPNLREALASAPRDLAELALALLAHDPEARPGEAAIFAALGEIGEPPRTEPEPEPEPVFVGRERELRALADAFERVAGGAHAIVYVQGPSGIGKTALCDRFLASLGARALVLRGRCYERENVPFKALDAVVDALARHLGRLDKLAAAAMTPRYAGELCRVFPVLGKLPSFADEPVARVEPQELRRRAFLALKELLARLAARRPLVIAIDDLQWTDADSTLLVADLIGPPDPPAILWLGATRSDGAVDITSAVVLRIAPLEAADGRALALALTGREVDADKISSEAAGSPFFIRELSQHARSSDPRKLTIAQLVATRVAGLPGDARKLLEVVAIAGQPLDLPVALDAAGLARADDTAVPVLRSAGLARTGPAGIECYHDRIRETVGANLGTAAPHHRAIADALERAGSTDSELLAFHYRAAGDRERALSQTERAAAAATEALAFDRAARHLQVALELVPTDHVEHRRRLERALGDALVGAGRGAEAADAYLAVARDARGDDQLVLECEALRHLLSSGHFQRGIELARRVVERVGGWFPRSARIALLVAALRLLWMWLTLRRLPKFRDHDAATLRRVRVERAVYEGLVLVEPMYSFYFGTGLAIRARRLGDREGMLWGFGALVYAPPTLLGRIPRRCLLWIELTKEIARQLDTPRARGLAALAHGAAYHNTCSFRRGLELVSEAAKIADHTEDPLFIATTAEYFRTSTFFYLGQFSQLVRRCHVLVRDAEARGNQVALAAQSTGFATITWLIDDDIAGAEHAREHVEARWPSDNSLIARYAMLVSRVLVALYRSDGVTGHRDLLALWPTLRRARHLARKMFLQTLLLLRGVLAIIAAKQDVRDSSRFLADARWCARKLRRMKLTGSGSHAEMIEAALTGSSEHARMHVDRAIAGFEAAEMAGYAAAARYRLAELTGDPTRLVEAAAWFRGERVVNVERFVAMLAPPIRSQ